MWRRFGLTALSLVVGGGLAVEDYVRRDNHRKYQGALESRRQLEMRVSHVLEAHGSLLERLDREQQRAKELSTALTQTRTQLEQAVNRISEETRNVQILKTRLSKARQQIDQFQSELALSLQSREEPAAGQVELERVIVSSAESPSLEGRILSVHSDWNFVVVDFGWNAVRVGDVISISRDGMLLAKARVERVQETACAATLLPEWQAAEIKVRDLAKML